MKLNVILYKNKRKENNYQSVLIFILSYSTIKYDKYQLYNERRVEELIKIIIEILDNGKRYDTQEKDASEAWICIFKCL